MTAASSITISNWLQRAQQILEDAHVDSARLDALVLLADKTGRDKSWLLAHPDESMSAAAVSRLGEAVSRRTRHEPLAYIRGKIEFYGHEFMVNEHVLVPRPESEAMLELLDTYLANHTIQHIADIGTGSGALAISSKLAHPEITVYASDVDEACIDIAQTNAANLGADVTFLVGDLLHALTPFVSSAKTYGILCNLPYVPDAYPVNRAATYEPRLALFGGEDGLDLYRRLFSGIDALPHKPDFIVTEALESQHPSLKSLASQYGYTVSESSGLAQLFTLH